MSTQNPSRPPHSVQGLLLAVFLIALVLTSSWLFLQRRWWLPELASVHGIDVDRVFTITLVITGILFVVLQLFLAFVAFRYRDIEGRRAQHWVRPRLEKWFALIAGLIVFGVDIGIFALGETQWFEAWGAVPAEAEVVEVTGVQFVWYFRYPGSDSAFGQTDPLLVTDANPLGIDPNDSAGQDDIVTVNQLHLPEGRPVRLRLRSNDVIHSFFLPHFRVKQDAVPGMGIEIWFEPTQTGQFEIACAQLCGLGHYRMRGFVTVEPQDAYEAWLTEMAGGGN